MGQAPGGMTYECRHRSLTASSLLLPSTDNPVDAGMMRTAMLALPALSFLVAALATPLGVVMQRPQLSVAAADDSKVNVTLFVMSRCPDARLCESVFDSVLQTKGVLDKVHLNMQYIAKLNNSSPTGATCKHGPQECIGNAQQLCFYHHASLEDFWAVVQCMNYGTFPGDIGTLDLARRCTKTVGVDWDGSGVGRCIEGKHPTDGKLGRQAKRLLVRNVEETIGQNVTTSCTIRIDSTLARDGKRTCSVDDGVWKGCDDGHAPADFVRVIEDEWAALQPNK